MAFSVVWLYLLNLQFSLLKLDLEIAPTIFTQSLTFCEVVGDRPHFLKFLESTLLLVLEACNVKATVKQPNVTMGWDSFDAVRLDLGPLLFLPIHSALAFHIKLPTVGTLCLCVQKPFV